MKKLLFELTDKGGNKPGKTELLTVVLWTRIRSRFIFTLARQLALKAEWSARVT